MPAVKRVVAADGEGAGQVGESLGRGERCLRWGVAYTDHVAAQRDGTTGLIEVVSCLFGEQLCLVVAAAPAASPVQWDGDEQIDFLADFAAGKGGGQQPAEKLVQMTAAPEFKGQNESFEGVLVFPDADETADRRAGMLTTMAAAANEGIMPDAASADRAGRRGQIILQLAPAAGT